MGLPEELKTQRTSTGCRAGIFWRIALPLARPVLVAAPILTFLASWNPFTKPLVLITDPNKFTLPLALWGYTDPYGQPLWGEQLAATTMSIIRCSRCNVVAQRHVVESFAFSGLKG